MALRVKNHCCGLITFRSYQIWIIRMPEGAFRNAEIAHNLCNLPAPQPPTSHSLDLSCCLKKIHYPRDSDDCQLGGTALKQDAPQECCCLLQHHLSHGKVPTDDLGVWLTCTIWFTRPGSVLRFCVSPKLPHDANAICVRPRFQEQGSWSPRNAKFDKNPSSTNKA